MYQYFLFLYLFINGGNGQVLNTNCFLMENDTITDTFLAAPVNKSAQDQVYSGERAFSVNLIKSLFEKYQNKGINENIFISPSSIYHTLMLAYFGAQGETQRELTTALGFDQLKKSSILKTYMFDRAYQAVRERTPDLGYTFLHANKIYVDNQLNMNQCLRLTLGDQIESVDFRTKSLEIRNLINDWVSKSTNGNIKDLIPSGYIDYSTRATIVNAAYFKGEWVSQFKKSDTKVGNFYVARDKIRLVKFMKQKGSFNYYTSEELQSHIVELPYQGDHISMIIILPPFLDDALQETVKRLTPHTLQAVMAEIKSGFYKMDKLDVQIPKFKIEQSLELKEPLSNLHINHLFGTTSNMTGFLDHTGSLDKESTKITFENAVHKSLIEVNEEGSEAAAATALIGFRSARPLFHTEFKADHPFLFLIYDKQTNSILFFGVYQQPQYP